MRVKTRGVIGKEVASSGQNKECLVTVKVWTISMLPRECSEMTVDSPAFILICPDHQWRGLMAS